jgi:hypothetical protein
MPFIMGLCRKRLLAVFILVLFCTLAQQSRALEEEVDEASDLQPLSWAELIFKGSRLFTSLSVTIQLSSGDQFPHDLSKEIGMDLDDCSETGSESSLLTVLFTSRTAGFSQGQYEEKIWFDKTAARPHSRIRMSSDDTPWIKSYCWEKKGVRRQKIQPENTSEMKEAPAKWTKHTEAFYMYPEKAAECEAISDPSLILVLLSNIEPDSQSNPHNICVFGKKQLHRLTIKEEKSPPLKVAYKERSLSQETAIEGQIYPLVFSISTENITPETTGPETFSFLGLQKDIRIYVDSEKRLPVRISGANNSIGRLVLDLRTHSR